MRSNAAGYVLHDKTWSIATGQILSQSGTTEEYHYDSHQRLIEKRSYGWGCPENQVGPLANATANGLIHRYAYNDTILINTEPTKEVSAVGVQRGTGGDVVWKTLVIRDSDRPDLIRFEYSFPSVPYVTPDNTPPQWPPDPFQAQAVVTEHEYEMVLPAQEPGGPARQPFEKRVRVETLKKPAAPVNDNPAAGMYWGFEKRVHDDKGRLIWRQYGSKRTSAGSPDLTELFVDYTKHDEMGRVEYEIVDAVPNSSVSHPSGITTMPALQVPASSDVARISSTTALQYATAYEYYPDMGEKRVYYPSGRQTATFYKNNAQGDLLQQILRDFETDPSGTIARVLSLGSVSTVGNGQMQNSTAASFYQAVTQMPTGWFSSYAAFWDLIAEYNASGALTGLAVESEDGQAMNAGVALNMFGDVGRAIDPDGTITRHVHDPLGRIARTYRGTNDAHPYWGTAHPTQPPPGGYTDNLSLVEKRYYGEGVSNAREVVEVRSYRSKVQIQYPYGNPPPEPTEDNEGWAERYGHDWRMRHTVATQLDEGPRATALALSNTCTFYDNLDRARFVAVYGPSAPSGGIADPRALNGVCTLPTAAQILQATPRPLRLTETVYNARGQVQDVIQYLCQQGGSSPATDQYLITRTFHDHGDRPLVVVSPGGGRQEYAYDAQGRQIISRVLAQQAGGQWWEITRTQTEYDSDGNALKTTAWERVHGSTAGDVLGQGNSVRSSTYSWYNVKKSLVATADIGTGNNANDEFAYQSSVIARPTEAPYYQTGSPPSLNRQGLPAWVKITCYEYDDAGRKVAEVTDADGDGGKPPIVTQYAHTDFGQVELMIENADEPSARRITGYHYVDGRLVHIGAILPTVTDPLWYSSPGEAQVTELKYGAEVVNTDFSPMAPKPCFNNGWVKSVHFPDPATGAASAAGSLSFKYFADGLVATRTDARGVEFRYSYDEESRLLAIDAVYPSSMTPPAPQQPPADRFARLDFEYDSLGNLKRAKARMSGSPTAAIVTDNIYEYDDFGNLLLERQQHGAAAGASSPRIDYAWAFSAALTSAGAGHGRNFNRLASMTYPTREPVSGAQRRLIALDYGNNTDDFDSQLGRITRIKDASAGASLGTLAVYAYAGQSRRVEQVYGGELGGATFASRQAADNGAAVGYERLDRFGRVKDLLYQDQSGLTQYRAQHGYDALDQRLYARVTQAASTPHDNDRSHLYRYDQLRRLVNAGNGRLTADNLAFEPGGGGNPIPRQSVWTLDLLGNWLGDPSAVPPVAGRKVEGDLDGNGSGGEVRETRHATDWFNRIGSVVTSGAGGSGSVTSAQVYDGAGNLIADPEFFYQYDAWNRLIQVNQRGTLTFDPSGVITGGTPGPWVVHFTYDALGRLVRRQAPWPSPGITGNDDKRFEHYYYDGVRRVAEVFTDPLPAGEGDGAASGEEESQAPPAPTTYTWTEREYVWGPGYVDELVCQLGGGESPTSQQAVRYATLDANYNVVALVGGQALSSGGSPIFVPGGQGAVLEQYTYDPYGQLLALDALVTGGTLADPALPRNRVGHQGLFVDRLDAPTGAAQLVPGGPDVFTGSLSAVRLLYHNRNRSMLSWLGRFAQADPNATLTALLQDPSFFGAPSSFGLSAFSTDALFRDGMNIYAYGRSSPTMATDPMGLFEGLIGLLAASTTMAELEVDYGQDTIQTGMTLQSALGGLFGEYGDNQLDMYDAALDWSIPDDRLGAGVSVGAPADYGLDNAWSPAFAGGASFVIRPGLGDVPIWKRGLRGERTLRLVGGVGQKGFRTSLGWRRVDRLANQVAHESKVGYAALTSTIQRQIAKDAEILQKYPDKVKMYVWHFFKNAAGEGGPSKQLDAALRAAGIVVRVH